MSATRRHRKGIVLGGVMLLLCLFVPWGCIFDDFLDCPTGIRVRFYSQSPCEGRRSRPAVSDLNIYVFDGDDRLVAWQQDDAPESNEDYALSVQVGEGVYTVIAWAGLNSGPDEPETPVNGTTTKADVLFRLREGGIAADTGGSRLWFGESSSVEVSGTKRPVFADTEINLMEVTSRVSVRFDGPGDYEVAVESNHGAITFGGDIVPGSPVRYTAVSSPSRVESENRFTILRPDGGYEYTLVVSDSRDGAELFRGDLLETLLLKNPTVDLACDRDFEIVFEVREFGTYIGLKIYVNGWPVHSYSLNL